MGDDAFNVVELVDEITGAVNRRFPGVVSVQGEVASMSRSRHGHVYFDLVDRATEGGPPIATVPVVLWASARERVNARLRRASSIRIDDGVRIRISGRVETYAPRGRVQIQMGDIDPTYTLGLLAGERDRVLQALEVEGLLHRNRSLELAMVPLRIGLVTAAGSAAEADVVQTLTDSGLAWRVLHVDARVQGVAAERDIAAALLTAGRADVDVVALVRGGGARTDLAAFDHELVARAIASLAIPVFTGIGHETDQSVADVVAHRAERTPTACAAALVDHVRLGAARAEGAWTEVGRRSSAVLHRADVDAAHRARRTAQVTTSRLDLEGHRLDSATSRLTRRIPVALATAGTRTERRAGAVAAAARAHLRAHDRHLDTVVDDLAAAAPRSLRQGERSLDGLEARVDALDPARALARGWSITRTVTGAVVRATIDIEPGDTVVTTVLDGSFTSVVATDGVASIPPPTESDPDAP
jgi:exodeoxyribonuclease VII large subunit